MKRLRDSAEDIATVAGFALVAFGLGLYSPPLLPIALGVGLLLAIRLGSR
jgi:hypothetical protein